MAKQSLNLVKDINLQIQEAQQNPSRRNEKHSLEEYNRILSHIIHSVQDSTEIRYMKKEENMTRTQETKSQSRPSPR